MEITYIYGNVFVIRSEQVGIFHKWKNSQKRNSCLIRLTINTKTVYQNRVSKIIISLFSLEFLLSSPKNNKTESEMAQITTATLDKLSCTDYVDFGMCQQRFGRNPWSTNYSNYLDIKLKVFKREDKSAEF